ncbi:hypothetical protein [Flavobacterium sp. KACC 22761]|uniref:hypothetical protein n=1 Tax=Flavobacterium sp. KACC 22761 TaxID=3092665 RepID=UPI002A756BE8|nr:hypothetical protein [Flavobacterium sp. KACC 22761]WPO79957.1 hypothetical protein SCB73_06150 [Flavobacterium sp. KACC 22761]
MELFHNNCKIKITEEKIECDYLYQGYKEIKWKISLAENLIYQFNSKETILIPEEIKEFQFEIEERSRAVIQEAVIYYLKKNAFEPVEFFRFCALEETKLTSQTKSYEFANEILKVIAAKYNIPFSFKQYVETKNKRRALSNFLSILFITIIIVTIYNYFN